MVKSFAAATSASTAVVIIALTSTAPLTYAASMSTGIWSTSTGSVKVGTTFDGGLRTYERSESGSDDAVFLVEAGITLNNVSSPPRKPRASTVCEQSCCTIENVWWGDVCKDALSVKGRSAFSISKVIGTVRARRSCKIFGNLDRSCGELHDQDTAQRLCAERLRREPERQRRDRQQELATNPRSVTSRSKTTSKKDKIAVSA